MMKHNGSQLSLREIRDRAELIYEQRIRPNVESCKGQFVAIDIDSGEYQVDPDDAVATRQLIKRCPSAVVFAMRIGSRAAYHLGHRSAGSFQIA